MSIKKGCYGFNIIFKVPNEDTERMDVFFETHQSFMRETHHMDGTVEPVILSYSVLKGPELNNPLEPNSGDTGHTLFAINEIYRGPEGCQAHMTLGQSREAMFAELMALTEQYMVSGLLGMPVEYSM
jgi:hypothetical protein